MVIFIYHSELIVKVKKGEIVDPLHDQDHDQSQCNLGFDFNNQYLLLTFLFKCVYKLSFILEVKIVENYQRKINLDNWS